MIVKLTRKLVPEGVRNLLNGPLLIACYLCLVVGVFKFTTAPRLAVVCLSVCFLCSLLASDPVLFISTLLAFLTFRFFLGWFFTNQPGLLAIALAGIIGLVWSLRALRKRNRTDDSEIRNPWNSSILELIVDLCAFILALRALIAFT